MAENSQNPVTQLYVWTGRSGRRLTAKDYNAWYNRFLHLDAENFRDELDKCDAYLEERPETTTRWFFFFERWMIKANQDARARGRHKRMRKSTDEGPGA